MGIYTQLYTSAGNSRMDAYLRHGKVTHPKDTIVNGRMAVQYGKEIVLLNVKSFEIVETNEPEMVSIRNDNGDETGFYMADDPRSFHPNYNGYTYKQKEEPMIISDPTADNRPIGQRKGPLATVGESMAKAFGMTAIPGVLEIIPENPEPARPTKKERLVDALKLEVEKLKAELAAARAELQARTVPAQGPAPAATTRHVKRTADRATYKQTAYLAGLTGRNWHEFADMTRGEASELITELTTIKSAVA